MKTVMKKMRRKTEEEKKDKLMNMSKMKKCMKTRAIGDFEYNTYNNRNDDEYLDNTHEYEEEEKEDRRREKRDSDEDEEHVDTGEDFSNYSVDGCDGGKVNDNEC